MDDGCVSCTISISSILGKPDRPFQMLRGLSRKDVVAEIGDIQHDFRFKACQFGQSRSIGKRVLAHPRLDLSISSSLISLALLSQVDTHICKARDIGRQTYPVRRPKSGPCSHPTHLLQDLCPHHGRRDQPEDKEAYSASLVAYRCVLTPS